MLREVQELRSNFKLVLCSLGSLMSDSNRETCVSAFSLKSSLEKSSASLRCMLDRKISRALGAAFSKASIRLVSVPSVKSLVASLHKVLLAERSGQNVATRTYNEACEILGEEDLAMPRIVETRVHRNNVVVETASEYFRLTLYLSYVDGLCKIQ